MHEYAAHAAHGDSLNRLAFSATVHCLTGCSIGEVLGMVIGTALRMGNGSTVALAIVLAFASDTVSIAIMEVVDNALMMVIPGALDAGLGEFRFWGSLALSLLVAGVAAFPVVRWLISRGRGHAVVQKYHAHH